MNHSSATTGTAIYQWGKHVKKITAVGFTDGKYAYRGGDYVEI
jgi:hypothetical protein